MKTSSIAVETSRSTIQSDSIVRQTNKHSSYLSYTTMNNKHIFNDLIYMDITYFSFINPNLSSLWASFYPYHLFPICTLY